jgi:hypothetical protein
VAFDLRELFNAAFFKVVSCKERGLTAVFPAAMPPRWRARVPSAAAGEMLAGDTSTKSSATAASGECQVTLSPLDIKTFLVRIA